jgi:hypothetical protein
MALKLSCSRIAAIALGACALASAHAADQPSNAKVLPTGAEDAVAPAAARSAVAADALRIQQELAEMTIRSSEGLKRVERADGVVAYDLQGRFMSVAIATPTEDGKLAVTCHTGEDAAAHVKHVQDVLDGKAPKAPKAAVTAKPEEK